MNAISLYASPSRQFDEKIAASIALLQKAAREFSPITQASSLGVEDMVVTELMKMAEIDSTVFVLDTGKLHRQTLDLLDALRARYPFQIDVYHPNAADAASFVRANGEDAMYRSIDLRKECCHIRKMEPLARALDGKRGWITGLRREQSNARAEVPDIEQQTERAKVNPIANWTQGDVWEFVSLHSIPYNTLHDEFFPSIGCEPCTRAVTLGEDVRSGRWWWEQESAKECGLHVIPIVEERVEKEPVVAEQPPELHQLHQGTFKAFNR